jgi:hypothetical protein
MYVLAIVSSHETIDKHDFSIQIQDLQHAFFHFRFAAGSKTRRRKGFRQSIGSMWHAV